MEWSTASEKNNNFFTLEHSNDGVLFESIATLAGAGNSTALINYSSYDYQPFIGHTYYRLKQTDYDGKISYSSIISIENKLDDIAVSNVHPNPTNNDLNFDLTTTVAGLAQIKIMDYLGRVVLEKAQKIDEGQTSLNIQMSELSKGAYTLEVQFSEGNYHSFTKVIKN
ncbi:MAG: T9SS type A sorting domain-containing protein [Bacteroidetes bacterium]|nr:T9SS type A sorting domain-containing protein [Bacteroidota bacterium]